ncbi:uncharacterized protein LOC107804219 [Nicotiana tabacum]|uniref:Uncharacterized protein LOC107804219 n=1 Tax=Nicotiana tabacum TaxID=4097 RepID=A0AC58TCZ7_TOBAC
MANNSENESDNDDVHGQLVELGLGLVEEVRVLKQQLAEITSIPRPPTAPLRNDPPTVPIVPTFTVPQPTLAQKSNNDPQLNAHDAQHCSLELAFKIPDSYKHTPQNVFPIEIAKPDKNMEQEEMIKKMKSLEQTMRNIQGLGGHKSAASVKPPMKEAEMIDYFLQAQDPDYLHYMLASIGKPFTEAIKIGEIVENGMKSGKIVSQEALKAAMQAIQTRSDSFGNRKKKEEGSMMASGFKGIQRGIVPSYVQFQQGQSNSPQHYYPPQGPRYSVTPQQYIVFNAQAYARPLNHLQWRAPIPQGSRQLRSNFQAPYNPRPRQEYVREQEPNKAFTPIGELYTSLYRKLMQLKVIEPIMPRYVNPNSMVLTPMQDKAIENLIEAKAIVVTNNEDTPNITNNTLPAHDNTHFIMMVCDDRDYKQSGKTEMVVGTIEQEPKVIVSPPQLAPLIVKGASSSLNLAGSEKMILYVPGKTKKVEVQLGGPKLYIPGGIQKIIPNNGLRNITEPVVIRPIAQLPVTNTKAIPWNYNKTVITYKGKDIVEEIDEMGGLTHSGRCYSPEELRKAKQDMESHLPVKEPVAEKEAEEFLKKMKMQDYSITDQLRKTPAQISLLSLLLHLEEHRRVLIKTLNEAYVSEKTMVNQLEKMAEKSLK